MYANGTIKKFLKRGREADKRGTPRLGKLSFFCVNI